MIANFAFSQIQKCALREKLAPISSEYCIMRAQWSSDDKLRVVRANVLGSQIHTAFGGLFAYTTL